MKEARIKREKDQICKGFFGETWYKATRLNNNNQKNQTDLCDTLCSFKNQFEPWPNSSVD